jgi:hypothetical protein
MVAIVAYRIMGDNRVALIDDVGIHRHFMTDETAKAWMTANVTGGLPTLASISPTTAVIGAGDVTVTLTGTNFKTGLSEVWIDGYGPMARTFVSATSMTIVLKPSQVSAAKTIQIGVREGVYATVTKPFTYTAT